MFYCLFFFYVVIFFGCVGDGVGIGMAKFGSGFGSGFSLSGSRPGYYFLFPDPDFNPDFFTRVQPRKIQVFGFRVLNPDQ